MPIDTERASAARPLARSLLTHFDWADKNGRARESLDRHHRRRCFFEFAPPFSSSIKSSSLQTRSTLADFLQSKDARRLILPRCSSLESRDSFCYCCSAWRSPPNFTTTSSCGGSSSKSIDCSARRWMAAMTAACRRLKLAAIDGLRAFRACFAIVATKNFADFWNKKRSASRRSAFHRSNVRFTISWQVKAPLKTRSGGRRLATRISTCSSRRCSSSSMAAAAAAAAAAASRWLQTRKAPRRRHSRWRSKARLSCRRRL